MGKSKMQQLQECVALNRIIREAAEKANQLNLTQEASIDTSKYQGCSPELINPSKKKSSPKKLLP
jgi:hypothetical protein